LLERIKHKEANVLDSQVIEFAVGDRVEVVSGMFDGIKGRVTHVDNENRNIDIGPEICVGFDYVLNLEKGRKDDVSGLLSQYKREVVK
jgi:preprotein translocase subunit YajC